MDLKMGELSWIIPMDPNVIIRVLTREKLKVKKGGMTIEAEVGMLSFEGGRGHQWKNAGGFEKLEKPRKRILH